MQQPIYQIKGLDYFSLYIINPFTYLCHFHSALGFSMTASDPLVLVDTKGNKGF